MPLSFLSIYDHDQSKLRDISECNRPADSFKADRESLDLLGTSRLVSRLFDEYESRHAAAAAVSEPHSAGAVEFFDNKHAIIFGTMDGEARKLAAWLGDFFALEVLIVEDRTYFHEGLYRCAAITDMVLIDRAAFAAPSALARFVALARALNDADLPVMAFGAKPADVAIQPLIDLYCDVTLTAPISLDALCHGVKRAADIMINGRSA